MTIKLTKKNIELLGFKVPSGNEDFIKGYIKTKFGPKVLRDIKFILENRAARKGWFKDLGKPDPFDPLANPRGTAARKAQTEARKIYEAEQNKPTKEQKKRDLALVTNYVQENFGKGKSGLAGVTQYIRENFGKGSTESKSGSSQLSPDALANKRKSVQQKLLENVGKEDTLKPPPAITADKPPPAITADKPPPKTDPNLLKLAKARKALAQADVGRTTPKTDPNLLKLAKARKALAQADVGRTTPTKQPKKIDDTPAKLKRRARPGQEQRLERRGRKVEKVAESPSAVSTKRKPIPTDKLEETVGAAQRKGHRDFKLKGKRLAAVTKEQLKESGLTLTQYLNRADKERSARAKAKKAHGGMTKSKSRNGHTDYRKGGLFY
jgi:hypothetical protein